MSFSKNILSTLIYIILSFIFCLCNSSILFVKKFSNKLNKYFLQEIYFQFGKENNDAFRKNKGWFSGASSPKEFELAQLTQRRKQRELKVGARGIGAAIGVGGKTIVSDFTFEDLGNNRYKITLSKDLIPGEYCFVFNSDLGSGIEDVWDFTLIN